jgi:hypothetical protein
MGRRDRGQVPEHPLLHQRRRVGARATGASGATRARAGGPAGRPPSGRTVSPGRPAGRPAASRPRSEPPLTCWFGRFLAGSSQEVRTPGGCQAPATLPRPLRPRPRGRPARRRPPAPRQVAFRRRWRARTARGRRTGVDVPGYSPEMQEAGPCSGTGFEHQAVPAAWPTVRPRGVREEVSRARCHRGTTVVQPPRSSDPAGCTMGAPPCHCVDLDERHQPGHRGIRDVPPIGVAGRRPN